jgi:hypothetical protein
VGVLLVPDIAENPSGDRFDRQSPASGEQNPPAFRSAFARQFNTQPSGSVR